MVFCYVESYCGIFAILLFNSFICALILLILEAYEQNRPDRVTLFSIILLSTVIFGIILYSILYYRHKRKLKKQQYLQYLFSPSPYSSANYQYDLIDESESFESDFQRASNTLPDYTQQVIPS